MGARGGHAVATANGAQVIGCARGEREQPLLAHELRRVGLQDTSLAKAQVDTIRTRLPKLSGVVRISVRRVRITLSSAFPLRDVPERALLNLQRSYPLTT